MSLSLDVITVNTPLYWDHLLSKAGFENTDFGWDWKFKPQLSILSYGNIVWRWFVKADFVIGILRREYKKPRVVIVHRPEYPDFALTEFDFTDKHINLIEGVSDIDQLPLCLPDEWARPIIESVFRT